MGMTRTNRLPNILGPVVGLLVGAALGIAARAWMRLISTDPEFTLNGTMFIVLGFTVFGFAQGAAVSVRRATDRRWIVTAARAFGFLGTLPLFVAAGGIMMPTVICGGLARHRTDWPTWTRTVFVVLGSTSIAFVGLQLHDDWGWSWRWWAGMAGLLAVYGAVISLERGSMPPQQDGWRLPGVVRVAAVVAGVLAMVLPVVGSGLA
jgi:hypothetical protein